MERQIFQKYAIAWYECALSYQTNGFLLKATEAYQNSISLNSKLQNKTHLNFLFGDYYLCLLQSRRSKIKLDSSEIESEEECLRSFE